MEKEKCYLKSLNKNMCTGCGACVSSCPKKCIKLFEDEEGFKYPVINKSKCINCKKCINTCPVINNIDIPEKLKKEKAFFYKSKDEESLIEASSGSAFEDICISYLNNKDRIAIFGAVFINNKVCHKYVTNIKNIKDFKKSKYVQSDIKETYLETKKFLNDDFYVVFSGTPCQIAGLKKFLNKEYDKLLCIDLICHGVPSQKLLDLYMESEQKKYDIKIESLNFREKVKLENKKYDSKNIKLLFNDGSSIVKNSKESSFLKGYNGRLFFRPSCYKCKFANSKRFSDITLGDAWGIEKINIKEDMHKGLSTIIAHTSKGQDVIKNLDGIFVEEIDIKFVIDNNSSFARPSLFNTNRRKFFKNLSSKNFEEKVNKYYKLPFYYRLKRKIRKLLNDR